MGEALSMGSPLVPRVSLYSDCRIGGFEALRWLALSLPFFSSMLWDHGWTRYSLTLLFCIDGFVQDYKMYDSKFASFVCTLTMLYYLCCIYIYLETYPMLFLRWETGYGLDLNKGKHFGSSTFPSLT